MSGMIAAIRAPITAQPTVQTARPAVWTRRFSARASASRGEPVAGPGRSGSRPDPRSRPAPQRDRGADQHGGEHEVEQQHPATRVGPGPEPGRPAQRREPAQPRRRGGVADGPQHEEHGDRAGRDRSAGARAGRQLGGHGADPGADQARGPATRRRTTASPPPAGPRRCRPARPATDTRTEPSAPRSTALSSGADWSTARPAEQLGAPGLLLDAGVAAYQGDREAPSASTRVGHRHLGHRQLAQAVGVEDRAVEGDQRRAGVDRPRPRRPGRRWWRRGCPVAAAEA